MLNKSAERGLTLLGIILVDVKGSFPLRVALQTDVGMPGMWMV